MHDTQTLDETEAVTAIEAEDDAEFPDMTDLDSSDEGTEPVPQTAATSDNDEDGVHALQAELEQKDELIQALTERLEEAAERLDRLHREGADRAPRGPAGGSSPRFDAADLNEQITQFIASQDGSDARDWMKEIDRKLDDLRSLVSSSFSRPSAPLSDVGAAGGKPAGHSSESPDAGNDTGDERMAAWEQMKAQLLGQSADEDSDEAAPEPASEPADAAAGGVRDWNLEAPRPIDLESADRETLTAGIEEREIFISHLIRRLRSTPSGRPEPVDWAALNHAPDDLRERLQDLEAQLKEVLRMEECDLSLERARLARERARLEQLHRQVEGKASPGGRHSAPGDVQGFEDDSESGRRERRWLRVFGFGRNTNAPEPAEEA